ncbi:MAG: acylphosphatase [Gammaproteobacteria bacterium]|nr:acylphosphatase [Gammaproteobacteria bacterium]
MKRCVRFLVSGKVQGVWYRAGAQEQALAFGITGYARNLPTGQVEILACGDDDPLTKLEAWLWQGPAKATVSEVTRNEVKFRDLPDFRTG